MAVDFSLYLITDRHQVHPNHTLYSAVDAALRGGVKAVQLREKDLTTDQLLNYANQLRQLTRNYSAILIINDRIDIAKAVDADGVHLTEASVSVREARQQLGDDKLIAASTHSLERALQAQEQGADFITFSPIFFTQSKAQYGAPQGIDALKLICQKTTIPIFALGGITPERVATVFSAGASGVALISAIIASDNPCHAAQQFLQSQLSNIHQ